MPPTKLCFAGSQNPCSAFKSRPREFAAYAFLINNLRKARGKTLGHYCRRTQTHFPRLRPIQAAFHFLRAAKCLEKPCVVLAAHPNLAPIAVWMKRLAPQIKVIVMAHGVEVWQPLPTRRHAALLAADIVLAASASTVQKLRDVQQVPPEKIRKLPWPLDPEVLSVADAPVILTVGRSAASEQYKGTDDLLHALAQLRATHKDLTLATVGAGDDLLRLQKLAADLGVATAVRFLSNLSKQ